jgi:hypothetical protein
MATVNHNGQRRSLKIRRFDHPVIASAKSFSPANTMSASQLRLNLSEGSVIFNFTPSAARDLQTAIRALMNNLKAASTQNPGGKPHPQAPMEYRYTGDVFLEVFCNPNIWSSPFAAKVLITLRDDRIRLSTEAELTRLNEDISQYLEQFG